MRETRYFDPLYGMFTVSVSTNDLLSSPEVRRLSQVRLLNTLSPTLATLGELRRYSHTLGVVALSQRMSWPAMWADSRDAFDASVLLHDIGTPPFGHLFEYFLRERGWHHEDVIKAALWGHATPENSAHQIFAGRQIVFRKMLKKHGISLDLVEDIVAGEHPLSSLLFGSMDLDNLDNVARMAWCLGIPEGRDCAVSIARLLGVDPEQGLTLPKAPGQRFVERWLQVRQRVYDILVYDGPTVAAQAVLSLAIDRAMASGHLSPVDWDLSDEELLARLRTTAVSKDLISQRFLGTLPTMVFAARTEIPLSELPLGGRAEAIQLAKEVASEVCRSDRKTFGYVFEDRAAFSKKVSFLDPEAGPWEIGQDSHGTVFYGFADRTSATSRRRREAVAVLRARLGIPFTPASSSPQPSSANEQYRISLPS